MLDREIAQSESEVSPYLIEIPKMDVFRIFFKKIIKTKFFIRFFSWNTVSIVEIFGFLPFSNWPHFAQKWLKIGYFWPEMAQN